VVDYS